MTAPKGTYRRRRQTTLTAIPRNIADWFAGHRSHTFFAYTPPYRERLPEYWRAWTQEHPGAVMPPKLARLLQSPASPVCRDDSM